MSWTLQSPLAEAVLAAFTSGLVPAEDLTIFQIAHAIGRPYNDPELRFALEDLEERDLLHRWGDRRWHLLPRPRVTRNAIFNEED